MVYEGKITGQYVYLQSADCDDAEFTLALRQDPVITKYLPELDITVEQQKRWISFQRKKPGDYFFVVRNNENNPIGTVGLYDIVGNSAESGRLALTGNALENTEASVLLFQFAFDILGLKSITGYIVAGNKRAERFNRQFGCSVGEIETDSEGQMIRRTFISDTSFHEAENRLCRLLCRKK